MRRPSAETRRAGCRSTVGITLIATTVLAACGSDGTTLRDTVVDPPSSTAPPDRAATLPPELPEQQPPLSPATVSADARPVTIDALLSPENRR